jgi:ribosomal protein S18 acetylase RimI-like enzyme
MSDIIVRVAKPSDRERVLGFTANTFSWGDYIDRVFDRWMADPSGRLLVAETKGRVVGMTFVKLTKSGEVWLQGGRVDKDYRRGGVGRAMSEEGLRIAKGEMKARVARVITDKTNLPPQKLLEKLGFKMVGEFTQFQKKAERITNPLIIEDVRVAGKDMIPRIWKYLKSSSMFKKSGGLYTVWFVWYSLEEGDLARFTDLGGTIVYAPNGNVHGVMLVDDSTIEAMNEKSMQSCYFDSDTRRGVHALSSFLIDYAAKRNLKTVRLWTFSDSEIVESLKQTRFVEETDESTEIVYSKELS